MNKRRALLATTALAAAAQFGLAAPAMADSKWNMEIGGFMHQYFGYAEGATRDNEGFDSQSDTEIHFTPSIMLDNGLHVGVNVQLEGQTDGDQIDQQFLFVESSYGRLELGSIDSAPYTMQIGVPSAGIGLDSGDAADWIGRINNDLISTMNNFSRDEDSSEKVNYYTPRFAGFQLGVTYVPQVGSEDADAPPNENDGTRDNGFGIGLNYDRTFNDFSIGASAGYMNYGDDDAAVGPTPENYGFGLSLGYAGFTVAGAYNNLEDSVAGDLETFGVGLMYEFDKVALSFGYIHGDDDSSKADSDAFELGASYALGPGVAVIGSIYYVDQDSPAGADLEGGAAVAGLALSF